MLKEKADIHIIIQKRLKNENKSIKKAYVNMVLYYCSGFKWNISSRISYTFRRSATHFKL